jgi:hypothetical protein
MKSASYYQSTADAIGVPLYLNADGTVTNYRKLDTEPTVMIEPHGSWKPAGDHGLGEHSRQSHQRTHSP